MKNNKTWIGDRRPLTMGRKNTNHNRASDLIKLFGKTAEEILNAEDDNKNRYVAFTGIRWGFAEIKDSYLVKTEKWDKRKRYNEYGFETL